MNRSHPSVHSEEAVPERFALNEYSFELPEKQIAQYPVSQRTDSRLLVLSRTKNTLAHTTFHQLLDYLPEDALLVLNTSRVYPGRLTGCREPGGGNIEFLLLTPLPLVQAVPEPKGGESAVVEGLVRPARKMPPGRRIHFAKDFWLQIETKDTFGRVGARMHWKGDLGGLLERFGQVPLPPYLKREGEAEDGTRYQTVYARAEQAGSVAAPTAGLHFDHKLLDKLRHKRIEIVPLNLFIGYGTFSPIRSADIREHELHSEYVQIPEESARKIASAKEQGRPVLAVGTTTVRSLEGIRDKLGRIQAHAGWVNCYIYPGYKFKVVDHLLTNFHLPRSSLLVMIAAFAGKERILDTYRTAVEAGYRFYSYGDAMLIL